MTEDEMVEWHHQLNGHEFEQAPGEGERQESLLQSMGLQRVGNITLPTKFHLIKAMVFPVVMYGCESWTIKKAEH